MSLAHSIPALLHTALAAGREVMAVYAHAFGSQQKADGSPVTEADLRADAVIRAGLAQLFPGVWVWSEESSSDAGRASEAPDAPQRFFLVDPLDGILTGGPGSDTFRFHSTAALNGVDTITDYTAGSATGADVMDFRAFLGNVTTKMDAPLLGVSQLSGGPIGGLTGNLGINTTDNDTAPNDDMDAYMTKAAALANVTSQVSGLLGGVVGNNQVTALVSTIPKVLLPNGAVLTLQANAGTAATPAETIDATLVDSQFGGLDGVFEQARTSGAGQGDHYVVIAGLVGSTAVSVFYVEYDGNDTAVDAAVPGSGNSTKVTLVGNVTLAAGQDITTFKIANFV